MRMVMVTALGVALSGAASGWCAASDPLPICQGRARDNCVVDGDTVWLSGRKIRLADIDAPETEHAKCSYERRMGDRATKRLSELLAPMDNLVIVQSSRSRDRYGRDLRTIEVKGQSVGAILIEEGLARPWSGKRMPWCGG